MSHIQILLRQVEGPGLEVHAFSLSALEALGWQTAVVNSASVFQRATINA